MTLKIKSGRQEALSAILDINFADPSYGVSENAIEVPANAIVIGGDVVVITPFNSATTATLTLGDATVATRYANAVDLKTAGRTALTLTGYKHASIEQLKSLIEQTGAAATAGQARITLNYLVDGRVCTTQGLDFRAAGVPGA